MKENQEFEILPDGVSLGIGEYPGRKRLALYVKKPGYINALAYFRGHAEAEEFLDLVRKIAQGRYVTEEEKK